MEKDHLEIILEDINGKFDLILEVHSTLNDKIDNVRTELAEKIESNGFAIKVLSNEVDSLKDEQRSTNQRLGSLERKVDGIATDLTAHRSDTEVHAGYMVRERPDGD